MTKQALKFDYDGKHYKMFFRYPDRKLAKLTDEEKAIFNAEDEEIDLKRAELKELLKNSRNITFDDLEIHLKKPDRPVRKGTGPITSELHIVQEIGHDENGKSIFKELHKPATVKFHTSSERNSYEKARQYAIHKYLKDNNISEDNILYDLIVHAYETRTDTAYPFLRIAEDLETIQ